MNAGLPFADQIVGWGLVSVSLTVLAIAAVRVLTARDPQPSPYFSFAAAHTAGGATDTLPFSRVGMDSGARALAPARAPRSQSTGQEARATRARDVWDDSVAPGGFVCAECRMPTESDPCRDHQEASPSW